MPSLFLRNVPTKTQGNKYLNTLDVTQLKVHIPNGHSSKK